VLLALVIRSFASREITNMWWSIEFNDGTTGYQKMDSGNCVGVYRADGTLISPEDKVEYTCVDENAAAPDWYVPPVVEG